MTKTATSEEERSGGSEAADRQLLRDVCDNGFDSDLSRTALALGRETDELKQMLDGNAPVDEDLVMKLQALAEERDIKTGNS